MDSHCRWTLFYLFLLLSQYNVFSQSPPNGQLQILREPVENYVGINPAQQINNNFHPYYPGNQDLSIKPVIEYQRPPFQDLPAQDIIRPTQFLTPQQNAATGIPRNLLPPPTLFGPSFLSLLPSQNVPQQVPLSILPNAQTQIVPTQQNPVNPPIETPIQAPINTFAPGPLANRYPIPGSPILPLPTHQEPPFPLIPLEIYQPGLNNINYPIENDLQFYPPGPIPPFPIQEPIFPLIPPNRLPQGTIPGPLNILPPFVPGPVTNLPPTNIQNLIISPVNVPQIPMNHNIQFVPSNTDSSIPIAHPIINDNFLTILPQNCIPTNTIRPVLPNPFEYLPITPTAATPICDTVVPIIEEETCLCDPVVENIQCEENPLPVPINLYVNLPQITMPTPSITIINSPPATPESTVLETSNGDLEIIPPYSMPPIIIEEKRSKYKSWLPLFIVALFAGDGGCGGCCCNSNSGGSIPFPFPIPIPTNCPTVISDKPR